MRCIARLFICITMTSGLTSTALAQTPSTQPTDDLTAPLLGKLFRSRTNGIQFCPPDGGAMIRELNSSEIVRFVYADDSWDVRVKPVPLNSPLPLSAPPDAGLVEITAGNLISSNASAVILRKDVSSVHGMDVGRIEATYNAGTDHIFAQQALFNDFDKTGQHYYSVQMTSKDSVKEDTIARSVFQAMLDTVTILDRKELAKEQQHRLFATRELYLQLDQKTITAAIEPLHYMRIVRDGREVGFLQVNERLARHNGNDGIEVIIHSRVQIDQRTDVPQPANPAAPADSNALVIPRTIGPAVTAASQPAASHDLYTYSTFFMTFDRDHEDWTTITQTDEDVAHQLTESAYTDRTMLRKLDRAKLHQKLQPATRTASTQAASTQEVQANNDRPAPKPDPNEPPMLVVPKYVLDVQYSVGARQEKPKDTDLPPFYLPQALGQLLPRLLPPDPAQYMFASYVSSQRNVMGRYLDVQSSRDVELDGQTVRVIPIEDRIGIDGIPTTHYVTRQGEWLGSVSDDNRSQVFPTDERTLKGLWPGFVTCPEPPPDGDAASGSAPPETHDFKVQNSGSTGR